MIFELPVIESYASRTYQVLLRKTCGLWISSAAPRNESQASACLLALRRIRLVIAALDAAISLPKNNLPYLTIILNLVLRKLLQKFTIILQKANLTRFVLHYPLTLTLSLRKGNKKITCKYFFRIILYKRSKYYITFQVWNLEGKKVYNEKRITSRLQKNSYQVRLW